MPEGLQEGLGWKERLIGLWRGLCSLETWAILLLLTSRPITSLTLRLIICEMEMSLVRTSWVAMEMK